MLRDVLAPEIGRLIDSAGITLNLVPRELFVAVEEMVDLDPEEEERLVAKIEAEADNPDYILGLLLISATISLLGDGGVPSDKIIDALENPEAYIGILNDMAKLKAVLDFLKKREDTSGAFERFISEMGRKIQESGKRLDQEMEVRLTAEAKRVDERLEEIKEGIAQNVKKNLEMEEKMKDFEKILAIRPKETTPHVENKPKTEPPFLRVSEYIAAALMIFASTSVAIHFAVASPNLSKQLALAAFFLAVIIIIVFRLVLKPKE